MRIVCAPSRATTVYAGLLVSAGTRHELPDESGMAHFVEHVTFKGTERRTAMQIINRMDSVGGELNAFTGKEETVYYSTCMPEHLERALELLTDIVFHSTFPQAEVEREVEVVCDEIESYEDTPSELIFDDFESMLFDGHPLGRNILGEASRLRQYGSANLQAFARHHYRPDNVVAFVLGNVDIRRVERILLRHTQDAVPDSNIATTAPYPTTAPNVPDALPITTTTAPAPRYVHRGTHQAHVIVGAPAFALSDDRYVHLFVLNNILGGPAMNSRLNISLRERRGLVYTVESSLTAYSDTGVWTTYFGCDIADVQRCLRLVRNELDRLCQSPLSPRQLANAKRQLCGQLAIANDNLENKAIGMAKRVALTGRALELDELRQMVCDVTPMQLLSTAQAVLAPQVCRTLVFD